MIGIIKKAEILKNRLFKPKESKAHYYAKLELKKWIENNPRLIGMEEIAKIIIEDKFCMSGMVAFTSDLGVYDSTGIKKFIEIKKTHAVDTSKLIRMMVFFKKHKWDDLEVIEVSAKYILDTCEQPDELKILNRYYFN